MLIYQRVTIITGDITDEIQGAEMNGCGTSKTFPTRWLGNIVFVLLILHYDILYDNTVCYISYITVDYQVV